MLLVKQRYLLAQLYYEAQEYQQSLAVLFELNEQFPTHKSWINKSFLLIADNYLALKEYVQAKATLESIIENAEESAMVAIAQHKLELLKKDIVPQGTMPDTEERLLEAEH